MAATDFCPLSESESERFYAYGFAQYEQGNLAEAADVFRLLCTKCPFESRFWFALGASLQEAKSYKEALNAWAMTALLAESDPYPHFHAAECYLSLGNLEDAAKALKTAGENVFEDNLLKQKIEVLKEQWAIL